MSQTNIPLTQEAFAQRYKDELGLIDQRRFGKRAADLSQNLQLGEGLIAFAVGNHRTLGRRLFAVTSHTLYIISPDEPCLECEPARLILARAIPPHSLEVLFRDKENLEEVGLPFQLDNVDVTQAQHFIAMFNALALQKLWGQPFKFLAFLAHCQDLAAQGASAERNDQPPNRLWQTIKRNLPQRSNVLAVCMIVAVVVLVAYIDNAKKSAVKDKDEKIQEMAKNLIKYKLEPESKKALHDEWENMRRYVEACRSDNNALEADRVASELEAERQLADKIHNKLNEAGKLETEWSFIKMQIDGLRSRNNFVVPKAAQ